MPPGRAAARLSPLPPFTELREGPLQQHLVSADGLLTAPARTRCHYPARVAPAISAIIERGWSPLWTPRDEQAAYLPAEES